MICWRKATFGPDLAQELEEGLAASCAEIAVRGAAAQRIERALSLLINKLEIADGACIFGSYFSGLNTPSSDLDMSLVGLEDPHSFVPALERIASWAPNYGFSHIIKVFGANIPLVKMSDQKSGMEVDLCACAGTGFRNSLLLRQYCAADPRFLKLGRLVKEWASNLDLVGVADGLLGSYAYMLLVIYYLQWLEPPVLPNLQALAREAVVVSSIKWTRGEYVHEQHDTRFVEDVDPLPPSQNDMCVDELLVGFFEFYSRTFNWNTDAVTIRLNGPGRTTGRSSVFVVSDAGQWLLEDPFDVRHNHAGHCTPGGQERIQQAFTRTFNDLSSQVPWSEVCTEETEQMFVLKCCLSDKIEERALLAEFHDTDVKRAYLGGGEDVADRWSAYLEFPSANARKTAQTKNGKFLCGWELQLRRCSSQSLAQAIRLQAFTIYDSISVGGWAVSHGDRMLKGEPGHPEDSVRLVPRPSHSLGPCVHIEEKLKLDPNHWHSCAAHKPNSCGGLAARRQGDEKLKDATYSCSRVVDSEEKLKADSRGQEGMHHPQAGPCTEEKLQAAFCSRADATSLRCNRVPDPSQIGAWAVRPSQDAWKAHSHCQGGIAHLHPHDHPESHSLVVRCGEKKLRMDLPHQESAMHHGFYPMPSPILAGTWVDHHSHEKLRVASYQQEAMQHQSVPAATTFSAGPELPPGDFTSGSPVRLFRSEDFYDSPTWHSTCEQSSHTLGPHPSPKRWQTLLRPFLVARWWNEGRVHLDIGGEPSQGWLEVSERLPRRQVSSRPARQAAKEDLRWAPKRGPFGLIRVHGNSIFLQSLSGTLLPRALMRLLPLESHPGERVVWEGPGGEREVWCNSGIRASR